MSKVVAVRKNNEGRITHYKLDNGEVMDVNKAVAAVDVGTIEGCMTFTTRDGDTAIRSKRGQDHYKLDDLPEF